MSGVCRKAFQCRTKAKRLTTQFANKAKAFSPHMCPQSPGISALRSNPLFLHSSADTAQQTHRLNEPWQMWSLISECKLKRNISWGRRANVQLANDFFSVPPSDLSYHVFIAESFSESTLCVCARRCAWQLFSSFCTFTQTYLLLLLRSNNVIFMSNPPYSSVSSFNFKGCMETWRSLSWCDMTEQFYSFCGLQHMDLEIAVIGSPETQA